MSAAEPKRSGRLEHGGRELWWELHGPGEGESAGTVCLLNGLAMSTESWHSFLPHLTEPAPQGYRLGGEGAGDCGAPPSYDVLLWDYPGQGRSTSRDEAVTIPGIAGHLEAILRHLEIGGLHLLGISYGGFIALDFARLYPQRLATLTLSGILLTREALFQRYQDLSLSFYRGGPELFDLYTEYMYEKIFGESFVRRAAEHLPKMRKNFHDRYAGRIHSLVRLTEAQTPFFEALERNLPGYRAIPAPTLVVAGEEDRVMLPKVQRKICDVIPDSRWEVIQDSGHVVYLEQTEAFFTLLHRFLAAGTVDF